MAFSCSNKKNKIGINDSDNASLIDGDILTDSDAETSDSDPDGAITDSDIENDSISNDSDTSEPTEDDASGGDEDEVTMELPDNGMGPGTEAEYTTDSDNSNGVEVNDDGELELDMSVDGSTQSSMKYLWASNSDEGTVSKVDTVNLVELARYYVGVTEDSNPSRTSVDLAGDVFVGNRNDSSVSKISADTSRCVDRNGDGKIQTSVDTNGDGWIEESEMLPRDSNGVSTDECVVWTKLFNKDDADTPSECKGIRGVAATPDTGTNYEFNGHVWIGCRDSSVSYKLNGNDGSILDFITHDECKPYGFVLDRDDHLWSSCRGGNQAAWIDYNVQDDAVLIKEPTKEEAEKYEPYGIAVDGDGNIWFSQMSGHVLKYTPDSTEFATDPETLDNGTWEALKIDGYAFRGIAVDIDGFVYTISTNDTANIFMIDPSKFPAADSYSGPYYLGDEPSGMDATFGTGVALDSNHHLWGVSKGGLTNGMVTRFKIDRSGPKPVLLETEKEIVAIGDGPYMYSDFTGYSLLNFASKEGWYTQIFSICPDVLSTKWKSIFWTGSAPPHTRYVIRVRANNFIELLPTESFITIVEVPSDTSPKDIPGIMPEGRYIEIEIRLYSEDGKTTPTVGNISFDMECVDIK